MNVLKKINKLRMDRNWSIYRLSLESGIPQSTITNMFNRETLPSITTLEMLCRAFGISLSEFFAEDTAQAQKIYDMDLYEAIQTLSDDKKKLLTDLVYMLEKKT